MACTCSPGKPLCRDCLRPIEERNAIPLGPTIKPNGEYALEQAEVFQQQFINTIQDETANPLTVAINKYGQTTFYDSLNALNNDFLKRPYIKLEENEYLSHRLTKGPILAVEFADFLQVSLLTPGGLIAAGNANGPSFAKQLDNYYRGDYSDSIMGGFCSLFANIFGAIDAFFNLIGTVGALIQEAVAFINKIRNIEDPIKALFDKLKVKALLEALKEKVEAVIEGVVNKVKDFIQNFNPEQIMGEIRSFVQNQIVGRMEALKAEILGFFSEENIERLKAKVKGLVDYLTGLFENPSLEEIQFLIMRFCALMTGIEGLINGLKDPLTDFQNRYDEVFNTLSNASNRVIGESIRAGAIRLPNETRTQLINNNSTPWYRAGNVQAPTTQEYREVNVSWDDLRNGRVPWLRATGRWTTAMRPSHEGWTMIVPDVKVLMKRYYDALTERGLMSGPLLLYSGYRNPAYNATLRGAAANSQHMQGTALDLSWSGFSGRRLQEYGNLARSIGFRGIGYYANDGFIHVDIGPERYWDGNGTGVAAPNVGAADYDVTSERDRPAGADNNGFGTDPQGEFGGNVWTDEEAANVEALVEISRNEDGTLTGQGEFTEGERAYARSKGYLSTPTVPTTPTNPPKPTFSLDDVGDRFDEFGNRIVPEVSGDAPFDLSDVQ